jgi:hypothetical protein
MTRDGVRRGMPPMTRRDVLRAGAAGAGALVTRSWTARAAPLALDAYIRDRMLADCWTSTRT